MGQLPVNPFPKGNNLYLLGLSTTGAPPKYDDPSLFAAKVAEYFEYIKSQNDYPTITGLALYLGFESRQSMYEYKNKPDFTYIVKRAQLIIESHYEKGLNSNSVAGMIFALKNMGWKDKSEVESNSTVNATNKHVVEFRKYNGNEQPQLNNEEYGNEPTIEDEPE